MSYAWMNMPFRGFSQGLMSFHISNYLESVHMRGETTLLLNIYSGPATAIEGV